MTLYSATGSNVLMLLCLSYLLTRTQAALVLQRLSKGFAVKLEHNKLFQFARGIKRYHFCKTSARDAGMIRGLQQDLITGNSKVELTIETNAL